VKASSPVKSVPKNNHNKQSLAPQIQAIVELIQHDSRILAAYLLGSVSRSTARNDSDIDIAVLPDPACRFSGMDILELNARFDECAPFPADVGVLSTDNLIYAKEAVLRGTCVYIRDKGYHDLFAATVLGLYVALRAERKEIENAYTA
jgi:uncharacterized protein